MWQGAKRLTVDGDGHGLVQNVAILALKGGDLAQLVELQVLWGGLGGVDLNDLKVEVVGLCNGANGRAPGVVLYVRSARVSEQCLLLAAGPIQDKNQRHRKREESSYLVSVELAESHLCVGSGEDGFVGVGGEV